MKNILIILIFCTASLGFSQINAKWSRNGDNINSGDWLGTTNNEALIFKTNNNTALRIKANGEIILKSLDLNVSAPSGFVMTTGQGVLYRIDLTGNAGQVLNGTGAWVNLPVVPTQLWTVNGSNIVNSNVGGVKLGNSITFGQTGTVNNTSWSGIGNRLLQTDASGNVTPFNMGLPGQVLFGNGAWGAIPSQTVAGVWNTSGGNLYHNGFVGINKTNPTAALDIVGDLKVSNNLYVGGGIVIADRLDAATSVTTQALQADTIHSTVFDQTTKFTGDIKSTANMTVTAARVATLEATGPINVGGDVVANSKLTVSGNATFNGNLKSTALAGGIGDNLVYVDPNGVLKTISGLGGGGGVALSCGSSFPWFRNGNTVAGGLNTIGTCDNYDFVLKANDNPSIFLKPNGFVGLGVGNNTPGAALDVIDNTAAGLGYPGQHMKIYGDQNGTIESTGGFDFLFPNDGGSNFRLRWSNGAADHMFVTYTGKVGFGTTFPNPHADFQIATGNVGIGGPNNFFLSPNKLLTVNGDVLFANNGPAGPNQYNGFSGFEIVGGDRVPSRRGISVKDDPNGDLTFFVNGFQTGNNAPPAFRFKNGILNGNQAPNASAASDLVTILADGRMIVGTKKQGTPSAYTNALFQVYGKAVSTEVIVTQQNWADYVFANDYKLPTLESVEQYVKINKHLPNVPSSKEIETDGLNVGEVSKIQMEKIEELTLYIISLKKEVDILRQKLEHK
jgi:hypothetical protein